MKTEIKYKTAGGNTVTWKELPNNPQQPRLDGEYACGGCGHRGFGNTSAQLHAQKCWAL